MSYKIETTKKFEKALNKCIKRGLNMELFTNVVDLLTENGSLPPKYRPHKLSGNYSECWECHIQNDWLLIWEQNDTTLTLLFIDTGTHSDLFG